MKEVLEMLEQAELLARLIHEDGMDAFAMRRVLRIADLVSEARYKIKIATPPIDETAAWIRKNFPQMVVPDADLAAPVSIPAPKKEDEP